MNSARLNGIERVVRVSEPTDSLSGTYSTDINYQGPLDQLNRDGLFEVLGKEGLDYSGVDHDLQNGFNDRKVMGEEAEIAKADGRAFFWMGLGYDVVHLEVLPKIVGKLESETSFEYASRILDKVVTYVETRENYSD